MTAQGDSAWALDRGHAAQKRRARLYESGARRWGVFVLVVAMVGLMAAGSGWASAVGVRTASRAGREWVEQRVSFRAGGITIYGTFRHPRTGAGRVPAALLIAGSGPTDRNGNSPLIPGTVNTLKTLADWLSLDGVASLRYDKLGSGQTGLGRYASHPERIGIGPFEQEAAAALSFLARQRGVDRGRLAVLGHSDGALFALLLATGAAGPTPPIHALGLLEPLAVRYLDIISIQVKGQVSAALRAGQITPSEAAKIERSLASAIHSLRTTGKVPLNLPDGLGKVLNPTSALFLSQADRHVPAKLAARLARHLPVIVSCSNADIQVTCGEVDHLVIGLTRAHANTDFVRLRDVDHVLKQDPSHTGANYGAPLPFSKQLQTALQKFFRTSQVL